ncbi:anti-sigma factor family protein [Salisaeta longa]|uniref:anti-sigma factor family protein n=1 Tax=Salisaeta longa TaxID=503170 RepID=UPI0003B6AD33|nr:zf-HC2 domain-containing protein [Salisaeta longa]
MTNPLTALRRRFMLTCKEVNDFLVAYQEGTLDAQTTRQFERHISKCDNCRNYLQQYNKTIELVQEACADETDDEAAQELVAETMHFLREHLDDADNGSTDRTGGDGSRA